MILAVNSSQKDTYPVIISEAYAMTAKEFRSWLKSKLIAKDAFIKDLMNDLYRMSIDGVIKISNDHTSMVSPYLYEIARQVNSIVDERYFAGEYDGDIISCSVTISTVKVTNVKHSDPIKERYDIVRNVIVPVRSMNLKKGIISTPSFIRSTMRCAGVSNKDASGYVVSLYKNHAEIKVEPSLVLNGSAALPDPVFVSF